MKSIPELADELAAEWAARADSADVYKVAILGMSASYLLDSELFLDSWRAFMDGGDDEADQIERWANEP